MERGKGKYILFSVQGRKFAIDIGRVKKVEKDKGNSLGIVPVEGAKNYVIGIGEIEVAQNDKRLIPFIDLRKIIDVEGLENGQDSSTDDGKMVVEEGGSKESGESKGKEYTVISGSADDPRSGEDILRKRKIFLIVSLKNDYIGILIDELLEIFEVEENKNAEIYPPPRGSPDIFDKVIVIVAGMEGKIGDTKLGWREKVFSINLDNLEKYV